MLAVAGDDDVGRALVLDLQHGALVRRRTARPAAWRPPRRARRPRTGGTTPRRPRGPSSSGAGSTGRGHRGGRAPPRAPPAARSAAGRGTTSRPARAGRRPTNAAGRLLGQHGRSATGRRVDPLLQHLELQPVPDLGHEDLAVEHELGPAAAPASPRPPRGSSASAAWCCGCASSTSSPSLNTMQRNPSHFGSKLRPPCLAGSGTPVTLFASIGRMGGITGRSTVTTLSLLVPCQCERAQPVAGEPEPADGDDEASGERPRQVGRRVEHARRPRDRSARPTALTLSQATPLRMLPRRFSQISTKTRPITTAWRVRADRARKSAL